MPEPLVTFHVEPWSEVYPELEPHWEAHWREVATHQDEIPLSVDWGAYAAFERLGQLHVVTARSAGAVVGYHISFVRPHLHYSTSLTAFTDVYWLHPDFRKGRTGIKLFQHVEQTLRARGVQRMYTGTKLSLDMGRLFERLGWTEIERTFSKVI